MHLSCLKLLGVSIVEFYEVWIHLDSYPDIGEIPLNAETHKMTISEILEARGTNTITHMFIERSNIPEQLDKIAPDLQQLRLNKMLNIVDQIVR